MLKSAHPRHTEAQAKEAQEREHKLHLCGWIFFVLSACCFVIATLPGDDPISLLGSIFFFLACMPFVATLLLAMSRKDGA